MKSKVLMLDLRGNVGLQNSDALQRHQKYAQTMVELSPTPEISLHIVSKSKVRFKRTSTGLSVSYAGSKYFTNLSYIFQCLQIMHGARNQIGLVVCGDPWETYWLSVALSRILRIGAPIQVQIHADLGSEAWKYLNLRNRTRSKFMGFALRHAQALRFTSPQQFDEIVMRGFSISQHHIVAPVPLNISSDLPRSRAPEKRPVSIGFVGRIHKDRGLDFFLDFVKKLQAIRQDFSVIVAGDGSMREIFLSQLNTAIGENRINYLGDLSAEELAKSWKKIGALINSAPAESFGRTLREALANGVPVIALESNGVRNALEGMQQNAISIFSSETSDSEIDALFKTALELTISEGTKTAVLAENEKNTIELVQDWIDLMHLQQEQSTQ